MAEINQINMNDAVSQWATVAVERFREAMGKQGINEGDLWKSVADELSRNGGDIDAVIFKFKGYGRFVDMGVGRGVPIGSRGTESFNKSRKANGQLKAYGRKAKPWYSKTKTREVAILRELLVKQYQVQTLATVESGLTFTDNETLI